MGKSKLKRLAVYFLIIVVGVSTVAIIQEHSKPNISELESKGDVQGLIEALDHWDSNVRFYAAVALGEIGDTRVVEPLIQALKDDNEYVRNAAKEALKKIEKSGK